MVFCCADFCFLYAILYTHYFAYYYDRHSQTVSVVDILSDLLVLLFGDPFFSFCTIMLVASLSIIVVVFFFLYSVLNVFILMHVDFVFI